MRIRLASTSDITEIVELSDQLGYPTNAEQVARRMAEILNR